MRALIVATMVCWSAMVYASEPPIPSGSAAGAQHQEGASEGKQNSFHNQCPPPASAIVVNASPTTCGRVGTERQAIAEDRSSPAEWWSAAATWLLAFVTLGLAFFTLRLWKATGKLVAGAEEASERQLRAYLSPSETAIRYPIIPGSKPEVLLGFRNYGKTPAYKVRGWVKMRVDDFPLQLGSSFPTVLFVAPGSMAPVAPTKEHKLTDELDHALTMHEFNAIKDHAKAIYVYGRFDYEDAFGKTRITTFRFFLNDSSGPLDKECGVGVCAEGNDET